MRFFSKVLSVAVVFGMLAASGSRAQNRDERPGGIGITVFEHPNYGGRNASFRDQVTDLSDYHLNDRVSSLRIGRGEYWEVCEHKDFGGRCAVFSGDEPDLSRVSWNDMITSLRPVRGGGSRWEDRRDGERPTRSGLVLHDQRNFRGDARQLDGPESDLGDYGHRVWSLNVHGRPWEVCNRPGFGGRCVTVSEDVADLRALGMENDIASARPAGDGYGVRRDRREREQARLILYERPDFRGRSREVLDTESEISDFNDRAQSVRVVGTWQLCEHKDFRGRCITVSSDTRDLETYRFRDTLTSARPVYDPRRSQR